MAHAHPQGSNHKKTATSLQFNSLRSFARQQPSRNRTTSTLAKQRPQTTAMRHGSAAKPSTAYVHQQEAKSNYGMHLPRASRPRPQPRTPDTGNAHELMIVQVIHVVGAIGQLTLLAERQLQPCPRPVVGQRPNTAAIHSQDRAQSQVKQPTSTLAGYRQTTTPET